MSLKRDLRNAGYDLIDSPIRNHKPLQLWKKRPADKIGLFREHINEILFSSKPLDIIENEALSIDFSQEIKYKFNIGLSVLDKLLTTLGLGNLSLSSKFERGKKVSLKYGDCRTFAVSQGQIEAYVNDCDLKKSPTSYDDFIENANRDNIIIISGILTAKNINAIIETNSEVDENIEAELTDIVDGKVEFNRTADNKLEMKSEGNSILPIAVEAFRIDWDKDEFEQLKKISDNRNFF